MDLLHEKKPGNLLTAMLGIVYFTSYISRLDYATVLAEIVVSEGVLKSEAALATTACFITYGVGQLISGWLGDRVSSKWLIAFGLLLTGSMNLLLLHCGTVSGMVGVWAVNGFAQAMLWPPMVKIMAGYLDSDRYEKATVTISMASSAATILLYLVSPLIIRTAGWRGVFRIASVLAITVGVLWASAMTCFEKKYGAIRLRGAIHPAAKTAESTAADASLRTLILRDGLLFVMIAIILQGILRDGVTTWLPSYLVEVFHLEIGSSILSSVIIPVFSMASFQLCAAVNRRFFKHEIHFSTLLFVLGIVFSGLMTLLFTASAACSALLAALLTACMHGINLMLICNLPGRFAATGKVSTISGVLNACTYVGSAVSTYGFALIAQRLGWRTTVVCWAAVCALGVLACIAARRKTAALFAQSDNRAES